MNAFTTYRMTILAAAAASLMLVACGRHDDSRTAGQKLDDTIAKVDQKTDDAKAKTEAEANKIGEKISAATDKTEVAMADAEITASIKAKLAGDPTLSALRITVDTKQGQVELNGTAPSVTSRERATQLAAAVKGVHGVDNHLVVAG